MACRAHRPTGQRGESAPEVPVSGDRVPSGPHAHASDRRPGGQEANVPFRRARRRDHIDCSTANSVRCTSARRPFVIATDSRARSGSTSCDARTRTAVSSAEASAATVTARSVPQVRGPLGRRDRPQVDDQLIEPNAFGVPPGLCISRGQGEDLQRELIVDPSGGRQHESSRVARRRRRRLPTRRRHDHGDERRRRRAGSARPGARC